jgi:hypothetical protein
MRLKRQSIVLTVSMLALACDDSKPPKAPAPKANGSEAANALGDGEGADGDGGADPAGRLNQPAAAPDEVIAISDIDAGEEPTGPLFEASYRLAVVADIFGGVNVCEGKVSLVVNRDFTFTLPTPSLSCAGGLCEVDMKAVMGMMAKPGSGGGIDGLVGGVNSDEKFLSVAKVGNFQFDPPRPLALLSPFHFDPISDAIKVNETYSGTVTDTTTGQKASGTLNLKVEEANDDRDAPGSPRDDLEPQSARRPAHRRLLGDRRHAEGNRHRRSGEEPRGARQALQRCHRPGAERARRLPA